MRFRFFMDINLVPGLFPAATTHIRHHVLSRELRPGIRSLISAHAARQRFYQAYSALNNWQQMQTSFYKEPLLKIIRYNSCFKNIFKHCTFFKHDAVVHTKY